MEWFKFSEDHVVLVVEATVVILVIQTTVGLTVVEEVDVKIDGMNDVTGVTSDEIDVTSDEMIATSDAMVAIMNNVIVVRTDATDEMNDGTGVTDDDPTLNAAVVEAPVTRLPTQVPLMPTRKEIMRWRN